MLWCRERREDEAINFIWDVVDLDLGLGLPAALFSPERSLTQTIPSSISQGSHMFTLFLAGLHTHTLTQALPVLVSALGRGSDGGYGLEQHVR